MGKGNDTRISGPPVDECRFNCHHMREIKAHCKHALMTDVPEF